MPDEFELGLRRRPLADVAGGTVHHARRAARCRSYIIASPLVIDGNGRAAAQILFPVHGARARSTARAEAACVLAAVYGVATHRLPAGRGQAPAVAMSGVAENVARLVAALPRLVDYAEQLASEAARAFGRWTRHSRSRARIARMTAAELRVRAREFRAASFGVAVDVLAGPNDAPVPVPRAERAPWEQVEAIAGGYAQYGWVCITEAYDPADARRILADATLSHVEPLPGRTGTGRPPKRQRATAAWEQLALPVEPSTPVVEAAPSAGPLVVIACSKAKHSQATAAGNMYLGQLHSMARKAADTLTVDGGTILILSARHGFLPLTRIIAPYDHRWTDPGAVTSDELRAQAAALGLESPAEVILLTPGDYTRRALAVWPRAHTPLAHLGVGRQRGRLAAIRTNSAAATAA